MLIFDQLKKNDPHLRLLATIVFVGMAMLFAGLWWVQIVASKDYQANLEKQSFRTVRVPAIRGKILDRNGTSLAENQPRYDIGLYLEDLSVDFRKEFARIRPRTIVTNSLPPWKRWLGESAVKTQYVRLSLASSAALETQARYNVASGIVQKVSHRLQSPLVLDFDRFKRHYETRPFVPYPVATALDQTQIARFAEQSAAELGVDLDIQSTRVYPHRTTTAHVLGHLKLDNDSIEGEEAYFSYRLPDYRGVVGVEYALDPILHGRAGAKSVLINFRGYRQQENIWSAPVPGSNVVLTIDLHIQQAAERALRTAVTGYNPNRGAAVVMDVNTGDILALASAPAFDPNLFVQGLTLAEYKRIQSVGAEKNRATQENYRPGSIFKTLIGLACLERGMDPTAIYNVQPHPTLAGKGVVYVGRRKIDDQAPPGPYDLTRALIKSSNAYFVANGIPHLDKIIELAERLHLGESTGLGTRQETSGSFPDRARVRSGWSDGDTANLCIGQGLMDVTPLQMTVMACALANGGKVLWPRLVDRIEPHDSLPNAPRQIYPSARVRNTLGVKARNLQILKDAMLKDVESPDGTGHGARIEGFQICGKTGTAQNERGGAIDRSAQTTWFLSFAPYDNPRYAVVVMVEGGSSGGGTCAPLGRQIYEAILEREQMTSPQSGSLARTH